MKAVLFSLMLLLVSVSVFAAAQEQTDSDVTIDEVDAKYFGLDDDDDNEMDDSNTPAAPEEPTSTTESPPTIPPRGHRPRGRGRPNGRFGSRRQNQPALRPGHNGRHRWAKNMTPEEKITKVCEKLSETRPSWGNGAWFGKRMSAETRQQVETIIQSRKTAMLACCNMESSERTDCVEEMLVARYDRVCNNEEPLCMHQFVAQVAMSTTAGPTTQSPTVITCCAKEGRERSQCFQQEKQKYRQQKMNKKPWSRHRGRHHGGRTTPDVELTVMIAE